MIRAWSPAAEARLRELYPAGVPLARMAFLLKRTEKAIKSRASVLGLTRGFHHPWTQADEDLLTKLYALLSAAECAEKLGRTLSSVQQRVATLGLQKSPTWVAERARQRWAEGRHEGSRKAHYPKGHAPANKGLRRPGWAPGRMADTQFKKGRPAREARNYQPIGTLRICRDGYLERKVTDDHPVPARRWVAAHRLVWEAANGPIPDGHIVVFKRGMHTTVEHDITIDRIELITRVENMRRNTLHNYPKEIAHTIQMRGALSRQINRLSKEQS